MNSSPCEAQICGRRAKQIGIFHLFLRMVVIYIANVIGVCAVCTVLGAA
jgi:hypothetical protein